MQTAGQKLSDAIIASGLVKNATIIHRTDKKEQKDDSNFQKSSIKSNPFSLFPLLLINFVILSISILILL